MDHRPHRRWSFLCGLLVAPAFAHAAPHVTVAPPYVAVRPRVQLTVALAGQTPTTSSDLGYFIPEVDRALGDDLRRGGLLVQDTPAEGIASVSALLEGRPGDRVVLSARIRGHQVDVEGTVESLDALVDELATRLVPLCLSAQPEPRRASSLVETPRPVATKGKPAPVEPEPTPHPTSDNPPPPTVTPTQSQPAPPPPVVQQAPPPVLVPGTPADPYGPDARVADAPPERSAFIHGRVVVHTLPDPAEAPQGTGSIATQALYAELQRRLHLSIVPMGVGVSSLSVAADEGTRAQARVVVMGRLDSFAMYAAPTGPIARLRLELSVVREGRLVMRRALWAETPANAIAAAIAEGRRGRQIDPVYLAVSHALEAELNELQLALGDAAR